MTDEQDGPRLAGDHAHRPERLRPLLALWDTSVDELFARLEEVDDTDLDTVGRSTFPHGSDPHLPLVDIVWWNTRELVHHASDLMTGRDLYAVTHPRP